MIGQVQIVNGVKTIVPVSGEVSTDSVTLNNMQSADNITNRFISVIFGSKV